MFSNRTECGYCKLSQVRETYQVLEEVLLLVELLLLDIFDEHS